MTALTISPPHHCLTSLSGGNWPGRDPSRPGLFPIRGAHPFRADLPGPSASMSPPWPPADSLPRDRGQSGARRKVHPENRRWQREAGGETARTKTGAVN